MIWPFTKSDPSRDAVAALYNAIVAQSRREAFYAECGVPDTVTGRFDMISLHMCLILRRLKALGDAGKPFSQNLFDYFFKDMDRSLREMGVGDLSVPKRIGNMGAAFYGLLEKLTAALDTGESEAVATVLTRNVIEDDAGAVRLTAYVENLTKRLERQDPNDLLAGRVDLGATP